MAKNDPKNDPKNAPKNDPDNDPKGDPENAPKGAANNDLKNDFKNDAKNRSLTIADLAARAKPPVKPGAAAAEEGGAAEAALATDPSQNRTEPPAGNEPGAGIVAAAPIAPEPPAAPVSIEEPLTDPYQVPVTYVDSVGPYGLQGPVGSVTLVTHRNFPGTVGAAVEPIVCARLRLTMRAAAHLHGVLGLMLAANKG